MTIISHIFRGRRCRVLSQTGLPKGTLGQYTTEGGRARTLQIPMDGDTQEELNVIIHESLHACTELDEDAVDETAADISRLLWRLGWRNGGES